MTEAAIYAAAESLDALLRKNSMKINQLGEEIERLRQELEGIRHFLKDADLKQEQDERVRNWVAEIRDLAYEIEDFIDTSLVEVDRNTGDGVGGFIKRLGFSSKIYHHPRITNQIKLIRMKTEDISRCLQTYGIRCFDEVKESGSATSTKHLLRKPFLNYEQEHVIGLEESKKDLLVQLMKEDDQLRVVSVVGMGGVGKTTLAKEVFNHVDVKRHFDCFSWVCVSQGFSLTDTSLRILRDVVPNEEIARLEGMERDELFQKLQNSLKQKRYLVVFDDIWNNELWNSFKEVFPNGKKGSKVLFTTRNEKVALYADPQSSLIKPPLLTVEQGWTLLCKKAFAGGHSFPQDQFETWGRQMVEKCGGLPLAIVVLGGLLAKRTLSEWKEVCGKINSQFKLQAEGHLGLLYQVLASSYHDLPFYLKPCLIYLSQFPDHREIHKKELVRLWIAEGFISRPLEGEGYVTMEDKGEQYLEELISRSLISVSQRNSTGNGVKTCCIHDLVRDLCLSKAREEDFLEVIKPSGGESNTSLPETIMRPRRIAIHPSHGVPSSPLTYGNPNLRSISYFSESDFDMALYPGRNYFKNFKLLTVLNFRSIYWSPIPKKIFELIHLRYLGLRGHGSMSIGKLRRLYTLDIRGCARIDLPDVLWKLVDLRHLLVDKSNVRHFQLDHLSQLETLKWIEASDLLREHVLNGLINLRSLGIFFKKSADVEKFLTSPKFESQIKLRSLKMLISTGHRFPNLEQPARFDCLEKLELDGQIDSPNLEFLPASLAKLTLRHSQLNYDPMVYLQKLPKLRFLSLEEDSSVGSQMICSAAGGFPQLEILKLGSLKNLEEWQVEEGSMPCLKSLHLEDLENMKMIPEGLKFIPTLGKLTLKRMPETFKNKLDVGGEDFYKVQHIPSISFV